MISSRSTDGSWPRSTTPSAFPADVEVVIAYEHERNSSTPRPHAGPLLNPALVSTPVDLEDLVLGYLEPPTRNSAPRLQVRA